MSARGARWLAWSMCALAVALGIGFLLLYAAVTGAASTPGAPSAGSIVTKRDALDALSIVVGAAAMLAFSSLGALIVARAPTHAIGWLFCAIGLLTVVQPFAGYYALYTLFVAPGALPGGLVAGWLQNWIWVVTPALLTSFVPLLFPTGRLLSARWKPILWLTIGVTVARAFEFAFYQGPLLSYLDGLALSNPFGVLGVDFVFSVLGYALWVLYLVCTLFAAASLLLRLRHARGEERRQIKWFVYIAAMLAAYLVVSGVVESPEFGVNLSPALAAVFAIAWWLGVAGLALAAGLAILRYHLFDIDILIHRTLVYGTLTALLAGIYVGLVIGGQAVVRALTAQRGQQPVVIVATTLLVAGLVTPLRGRIQKVIDRRFYRSKYDAQKTLASFSATLRQEVSLTELRARLLAVVEETMQPEHVSLWLRPPDHLPAQLDQSSRLPEATPLPPQVSPSREK
jgi:hypothetical protein